MNVSVAFRVYQIFMRLVVVSWGTCIRKYNTSKKADLYITNAQKEISLLKNRYQEENFGYRQCLYLSIEKSSFVVDTSAEVVSLIESDLFVKQVFQSSFT